jgi:hypothetical protein
MMLIRYLPGDLTCEQKNNNIFPVREKEKGIGAAGYPRFGEKPE